MKHLCRPGKATFMLGGQWGSEGKGCATAYLTKVLCEQGRMFDIVTTNNGAQSGHTSVHNGKKRVAFHLPTSALIAADYGIYPTIYLNGGAVIDPEVLKAEIDEFRPRHLFIHPYAAVITPECKEAEGRADSAQTKIASTRKGVGEALARKVLRSGMVAKDHPFLKQFTVTGLDHDICYDLYNNNVSVLVEVPQGLGLSVDGGFYPHTTSRNCTIGQAMADAGIHPQFYGGSMLVLRTYPIRVGNITDTKSNVELGQSGGCYPDQHEISWNELGVEAEITTVTKRVRRVFTFSREQLEYAMIMTRPEIIMLTFCNYPDADVNQISTWVNEIAHNIGMPFYPQIWHQYGPSTDDVRDTPF